MLNRPSHWILVFLLAVGGIGTLAWWVSNGETQIPRTILVPQQKVKAPLVGEGFVKDPNGEPARDAELMVRGSDERARTDATGRYRIALPRRELTLLAHDGKSLVAQSEPLVPSRDEGLVPLPELTLETGIAVRGYVRDEHGNPLAEVPLGLRSSLGTRETTSRKDGGFGFAGLIAEPVIINANPRDDHLGTSRSLDLHGQGEDVELTLAKGAPMRVQVVDEQKAPRAAVHVTATDAEGRRAEADSEPDGFVTLRGVAADGLSFRVPAPLLVLRYEAGAAQLLVR